MDLLGWWRVAGNGSVSETLAFCGVLAPCCEFWGCMSLHYQWGTLIPILCFLAFESRAGLFLAFRALQFLSKQMFISVLEPHALDVEIKLAISFLSWKTLILLSSFFSEKDVASNVYYHHGEYYVSWQVYELFCVWEGSQSFLLKLLCFANGTKRILVP